MKKAYQAPTSEAISLYLESAILTDSSKTIPTDKGTIGSDTEILTNRHGWNSSNWSGTAGDED